MNSLRKSLPPFLLFTVLRPVSTTTRIARSSWRLFSIAQHVTLDWFVPRWIAVLLHYGWTREPEELRSSDEDYSPLQRTSLQICPRTSGFLKIVDLVGARCEGGPAVEDPR